MKQLVIVLIVWEDYLIYAYMFGINNEVIEKIKEIY